MGIDIGIIGVDLHPKMTRVQPWLNGPESISLTLADWTEEIDVKLEIVQPGKPPRHSYIEHLNRTYRDELCDLYLLWTLREVRHYPKNRLLDTTVNGRTTH